MDESERLQTLADFLRTRRARLAPGDVGLPTGFRRRTPGLRREEVAQLANIGVSWYLHLSDQTIHIFCSFRFHELALDKHAK